MPPNPPYEDLLTRESSKRLAAILRDLPEPVALGGGHGVRYRVGAAWRNRFGQDYFGSQDIDVVYQVGADWTEAQIRASAIANLKPVLGDLGYRPAAMNRFQAILDRNGKRLDQEPRPPAMLNEDFYYLYVDPIMTSPNPRVRDLIGYPPIVEPVLGRAFTDPRERDVLTDLGPNVYLPSTPLLIAAKLRSLPLRGEGSHKAIKDICDLFALTQFGGVPLDSVRERVHQVEPRTPELVNEAVRHPQLDDAVRHLDTDATAFRAVVGSLAVRKRP